MDRISIFYKDEIYTIATDEPAFKAALPDNMPNDVKDELLVKVKEDAENLKTSRQYGNDTDYATYLFAQNNGEFECKLQNSNKTNLELLLGSLDTANNKNKPGTLLIANIHETPGHALNFLAGSKNSRLDAIGKMGEMIRIGFSNYGATPNVGVGKNKWQFISTC